VRLILTIFAVWIMWINYLQTADALPVSILPNVVYNLNSSVMENQTEIWKDVKGYEGLYQVSSFGNVKSLERAIKNSFGNNYRTVKEKLLKPGIDGFGNYYYVGLSKNRVVKNNNIHQLVAIAFHNHKPCGCKLVVNHIDFNKLNNHYKNLEIITTRENSNKKHLKSSSEYIGIYWDKTNKKWTAQIQINGKRKHLGRFVNEIDAHLAYQNELKKII